MDKQVRVCFASVRPAVAAHGVDVRRLFYRERAMSLNIGDAETCRLARELARLTGETMTGAITVALRERLEREKRRRDADALARDLHAIGQRCAGLLGPGPSAVEHGDLLYDERGLPR